MPPADAAPDATSTVIPAGTHALVVYSDLRCPWAHVAVHRLLAAAERRGVGSELFIDHRWFPLGDEALPDDAEALDRELGAIRAIEPDAGWSTWADSDHPFPTSSRRAAAWVQAAKAASPDASAALDRALRRALFAERADLTDDEVIEGIAADLASLDLDAVRAELSSERPEAELDRQREQSATDLVPASPTIVAADGTSWTNPGVDFEVGGDGTPEIEHDDPAVYDEIIETYLAQRHYD
jgi:predicted DsbA family dithiol-disulfide isomerase